ncbi:MAG: S9 family peptidase [Acidimicrobiaceae bacterium]|nr:S9 family peptidase [Acidimicrobiaceae bacterium]MYF41704.1 S9 family peptidase [Acidimicrobiaceae bacterium]MYJ35358.1 S9 family peptidase [Acidimicrobiaceae bacterium]
MFLRSSGPVDPVNSLWVLDVATSAERLVVDPRRLTESGDRNLPPAEQARRERVRETGSGIVSYDVDDALTAAVFALDGQLWRVSLVEGGPPEPLAASPGAFDPRLSPDGARVAYVAGPILRVTGDAPGDRAVVEEAGETVTWGSAEFVAAEEMGRTRGHWWSPDGRRLLAARVDTSPVPRWWIADAASPGREPTEIRYPAAGEANAEVALAVFDLDDAAEPVTVAWDEDGWEYLAAVRWSADGLLLTVQTRDQRTLGVLQADPDTGACRLLRRITDAAWVDLVPGVPRLAGSRLVTVEDRGSGGLSVNSPPQRWDSDRSSARSGELDTARRLCVDGEALTPDDMQVRAVHNADEAGVVVTASVDPAEVHAVRVGWDGALEWLTTQAGVHGVAAGGNTTVIASRSLEHPGRRCTVRSRRRAERDLLIASHAADPGLDLNVEIVELGPRRLVSAVVLPSGPAAAGDGPLPVLLDPYGGPHAQRVQRAEALFHTSQWFAEAGFAVLVVDGRGTPGRGPAFERAVRGDLADPVLEDQIEALGDAADRYPVLDLARVAIRGWSFGGYLAALAVLRRPDVFAAAIAGAPVTDWRLYDTHYTERYLGHPADEPGNYERTDLGPLAPGLQRPLMLIHGLADDNVVAAHTLRLSQALTEAGRAHTVLPLSGITHMTPQEEVAENLLLLQLRFLQDALGLQSSNEGGT